ncbi:TPA: ASCH domain-containing protein [Desulfurococcaceae archaeon]|nr:ASCH domain-containing protein [Desulfurococcaceae archaeon]
MKLEERWFELIASGEKVVEGRVYDEKRKRLRVGHVIQFKSVQSGKLLYAKVKKLVMYKNFKEMLESEDRVLPGLSVEEGLKVYEKYYGPEAGPALAIGLEVL